MTAPSRPEYGRLYGITYDKNSRVPMIRPPRVMKVSIGIPKGRAIQIFLHAGKWNIRHGAWEKTGGKDKLVMKTVFKGGAVVNGVETPNTRAAAEAWHNANKQNAAISNRPQKIPYFTFTRRTIIETSDGKPAEVFEPDFDAIEAHGDAPRRISVILTSENPLQQSYEWWTASELKCHGDGLLAERAISAGSVKDPGWQEAKDAGQKMFVFSPCYVSGCPHAGVDCKPHSTLNMQLAYAMRLGATSYFTSTGQVSADQLFSSLWEIREPIERRGYSIAGIPLDLVLGSFRANHDGKPSIQPCVSLELRARAGQVLDKILAENSWVPAQLGAGPKMIAATQEEAGSFDAPTEVLAPAIAAEFIEAEFDDEDPSQTETPPPAAVATQLKQAQIAETLRHQREAQAASTAPAPPPTVVDAIKADPASGSTGSVHPPVPQWHLISDRATMNATLTMEKSRVGDFAFAAVLKKHNTMMGNLKADDPVALAIYQDLRAIVTPSASPVEDPF